MHRDHFITTDSLEKKLGSPNLSIINASWYMPSMNFDAHEEYLEERIPGAVFFDLDGIADQSSTLPHMLASAEQFAKQMGELGVSDTHDIVIYDGPGLFSAARVWWNLRIMGAKSVRILEGGYDLWDRQGRKIDETPPAEIISKKFTANLDHGKVIDAQKLYDLIKTDNCTILDARSNGRFTGDVADPREGVRPGHMPGATSLPFDGLIDDGILADNDKLREIFAPLIASGKPIVTSCGSGVTASVLTLAMICAGFDDHVLFDGSWTQWGSDHQFPVVTGK